MLKIYTMACVILDEEKRILLLKRASDKKFFPNKWAVVAAAPLKKNTNMEEVALREIKDELGQEGTVIKRGKVINKKVAGVKWVITPFVASIKSKKIVLNKEHTEAKWVSLDELGKYDLVPGLMGAIQESI